jgi:hypothetical protein
VTVNERKKALDRKEHSQRLIRGVIRSGVSLAVLVALLLIRNHWTWYNIFALTVGVALMIAMLVYAYFLRRPNSNLKA